MAHNNTCFCSFVCDPLGAQKGSDVFGGIQAVHEGSLQEFVLVRFWAEGGAACDNATSGTLCVAKAALHVLALVPIAAALLFLDVGFPDAGQGLAAGVAAPAAVGIGVPRSWMQRREPVQERPNFLGNGAVSCLG